jgi:hypothetical protein
MAAWAFPCHKFRERCERRRGVIIGWLVRLSKMLKCDFPALTLLLKDVANSIQVIPRKNGSWSFVSAGSSSRW